MSKQAAIQYKAYKLLLESDELTSRQKQLLIEFNFFEKIGALFGTVKNVGGTLMKAMKDKVYQDQLVASQKKIQDELADLKAIGAKVGKGDAFVNEFLMALLKDAGIDPAAIAAVNPASDAATPGTETGGPKPGAPVTPETLENDPALAARIIAAVTKKSEKAVAAEIEKNNPDAVAYTQLLSNAIAELSNQPSELVSKVLGILLNKGHVKLEGKAVNTRAVLIKMIKTAHVMCENVAVMNRWQVLAGLQNTRSQLLYEGPATNDIIKGIKYKKIKNTDELNSVMITEGRTSEIIGDIQSKKINTPEALEARIKQATTDGQGSYVLQNKDKIMAAFKKVNPDVKPAEEKKINTALETADTDAPSGGKEASQEDQKKAEEMKKEFPQTFKDVRAALNSEEVSDDAITAIMNVIDKLKVLKLK